MFDPRVSREKVSVTPSRTVRAVSLLAIAAIGVAGCVTDAETERFDEAQGFYDIDAAGASRVIRNDLTGGVSGMIQFAQSHVVDPSGNAPRNMPDVVTARQAVLLFTPSPNQKGPFYVDVLLNGQTKLSLAMTDPVDIDRSDVIDAHGRPSVLYSKRAWSAKLPWDIMRKGMSLRIKSDAGGQGELAADRITFAAPAHLTVWGIRLGMLTDPPVTDKQLMLSAGVGGHRLLPDRPDLPADRGQL